MPSSTYFDNLGLNVLKQFAQEWVNDFKNIKIIRIELRRFSTPRRLVKDGPQAKVLYAVVFWTLEDNDDDLKMNDLLGTVELEVGEIGILPYFSSGGWRQRFLRYTTLDLEQRNHEQQVRGGFYTSPFNRLLAATKYMQTVPPTHYPKLFGNDFKNVYKTGAFPGDDYLKEWTFVPLAKGENLPLALQNNTPPVILYQKKQAPLGGVEKFNVSSTRRHDPLRIELISILKTLPENHHTPSYVMAELKKFIGKGIITREMPNGAGVVWQSSTGEKKLDIENLAGRLSRLKNG